MTIVLKILIYGALQKFKKTLLDPPKKYLKIKKKKKKYSITDSGMSRIVHTNFYPNPLKLIYNLDFLGKKMPVFLVKSVLKIKIAKKGLVALIWQQFTICMPNVH